MFDQEQYEQREAQMLAEHIANLERAPLAERREARADWLDAMRTGTDTIAERAAWLFEGAYGFGPYQRAHRIADQKRGNREAAIGQLLAAVEWLCPPNEARQAWGELTPAEQEKITAIMRAAIDGRRRPEVAS